MANDDLKKRIEAYNKKPLEHTATDAQSVKPVNRKPLRNPKPKILRGNRINASSFEDLIQGKPVTTDGYGSAFCIVKSCAQLSTNHKELAEGLLACFPPHTAKLSHFANTPHACADRIVFLDTETLGLKNDPIFLIGMLSFQNGMLESVQYFARNYQEEPAILQLADEKIGEAHIVVTYNGAQFDVPLMKARSLSAGISWRDPYCHVDLLPVCRKIFRGILPNCRLETVERKICGIVRNNDLPGKLVPSTYKAFLQTGNAEGIARVIQHNLDDLLSLLTITTRIFR